MIDKIFEKSTSGDADASMEALTDLGLLIERHTQNRYDDESYRLLFSSTDFFKYRLSSLEANSIVYFFIYYVFCINRNHVVLAWCLGKCYGYDVINGFKYLINEFKHDDGLLLQIMYSLTAVYEFDMVLKDLKGELESMAEDEKVPDTRKYIIELFKMHKGNEPFSNQ